MKRSSWVRLAVGLVALLGLLLLGITLVGGTPVGDVAHAPWVAAVCPASSPTKCLPQCTGVLLGTTPVATIATAGHCAQPGVHLRVRWTSREDWPDYEGVATRAYRCLPFANGTARDLGLVMAALQPVTQPPKPLVPIPLDTAGGRSITAKVFGWGAGSNNPSEPPSLSLRFAWVTLLDTFTLSGQRLCPIDSGGPLVAGDRLVGVTSAGACAGVFPEIAKPYVNARLVASALAEAQRTAPTPDGVTPLECR